MSVPNPKPMNTLINNICTAARDGYTIALISALNNVDRDEQQDLINAIYVDEYGQKVTPLVLACLNSRFKVVRAILMTYDIDIEKLCTVRIAGQWMTDTTALWCACASGDINIVKMLIENGANINKPNGNSSTPLRVACYGGRLDIVKYLVEHGAEIELANSYNNTCLMISASKGYTDIVSYLLSRGALPNRQAKCGATALHYAAELGHEEICKILLQNGARLIKNNLGLTAVISAAERVQESVVNMFIDTPNLLTKEEKIDAYELLGASFANVKNHYSIVEAFKYLLLGMKLRFEDPDNIIRKTLGEPVPAYENWVESQSIQELEAIQFNNNSIHMESLAIRERILGVGHPDLPNAIIYRGSLYADLLRFDRCESLWMYAIHLKNINSISVDRDLLNFAQLYARLIIINAPIKIYNLLQVISICTEQLKNNAQKLINCKSKDKESYLNDEKELIMTTALYLVTILTVSIPRLIRRPSRQKQERICDVLIALNKVDPRLIDGQSLLHLAVNGDRPTHDLHVGEVCIYPCVITAQVLLTYGAKVYATDSNGNTALHVLISTIGKRVGYEIIHMVEKNVKVLIAAGIHFDTVNKEGLKASDLPMTQVVKTFMNQYEKKFLTLKCLASRCIAAHMIPYKGIVPKALESFLEVHGAKTL